MQTVFFTMGNEKEADIGEKIPQGCSSCVIFDVGNIKNDSEKNYGAMVRNKLNRMKSEIEPCFLRYKM